MQSEREGIPFRPYAPGTQPPYDAPAYGSTHKRHPQENLVRLPHTITELSGPRFAAAQFPPIPDLSVVDGKAALVGAPPDFSKSRDGIRPPGGDAARDRGNRLLGDDDFSGHSRRRLRLRVEEGRARLGMNHGN